ncbi:C-C chemokine receptor type 6 isoform X3 [Rhinatrema bivittatum]|uniref:C-C chemokine receptor type 6 isoform X3 n=1 Tax=Rhinatrema bivittatum TaxID=194408 RepID=UPI001128B837|nr:C-C chemokine receptor type 6 isoform X3 [Rhinatrema bivittatum]
MSAMEEDTELRDLLVQTLENSGTLNKIKAELRAAVFLALEEQEKIENKTPLANESLKKFLNTKDGRLVSSLVKEFLQFFNLDFTLAVFQPETSIPNKPEDRENLALDLGIVETESTKTGPLLLEVIKRCHQKDKGSIIGEELSPKQITEAKNKFDLYDKDKTGEINKDELRTIFMDLFPHFHRNMLEKCISNELKATDKDFNNGINFKEFVGIYKCLFIHCRNIKLPDGKSSTQSASSKVFDTSNDTSLLPKDFKSRNNIQSLDSKVKPESKITTTTWDAGERNNPGQNEDDIEGDSFFDDSLYKREKSLDWITGKNSDTEEDADDMLVETGGKQKLPERSYEPSKQTGGLASLSNAPRLINSPGSLTGGPLVMDPDKGKRNIALKDLKAMTEKIGLLELGPGDEDDDYIDDFNSTSHRSEKSEISIGEEIEEISVEGEDFNASDKMDDITLDHTISHVSDVADYLEDVA